MMPTLDWKYKILKKKSILNKSNIEEKKSITQKGFQREKSN
jgi:hypothetical protein